MSAATWDDAVYDQHRFVRMARPEIPDSACCATCEYFSDPHDGSKIGDCLNASAETFQRREDEICKLFTEGAH